MVDRSARIRLSELTTQLASGDVTNFEFEDSIPDSDDPAVVAIAEAIWRYYDDLHEHTLSGRFALTRDGRAVFARIQSFLSTDHQYRWRHPLVLDLLHLALGVVSLGVLPRWIERARRPRWFGQVWPFSSPAEHEAAAGSPG